jgi:hypothetical protein
MTEPKMSRALRISEDAGGDADDGHGRRDIGDDDRARADGRTAADTLAGDNTGSGSEEDAVGDPDMAGDITLGA